MKPKILAVDDSPDNLLLLEGALEDNFEVTTVASGHECLDIIEENHPDLILLDVMMPKMDGYQVCKIIKIKRKQR